MSLNQKFLLKLQGFKLIDDDFLEYPTERLAFSRIIANPPFHKNSDIVHIRKMYDCLTTGGILVSICSKHWMISQNKKETEFKEWLREVGAEFTTIEAGAFKESGTMVGGLIIKIRKQ